MHEVGLHRFKNSFECGHQSKPRFKRIGATKTALPVHRAHILRKPTLLVSHAVGFQGAEKRFRVSTRKVSAKIAGRASCSRD